MGIRLLNELNSFNSPFAMRSFRTGVKNNTAECRGFQFALCDEVLSDPCPKS